MVDPLGEAPRAGQEGRRLHLDFGSTLGVVDGVGGRVVVVVSLRLRNGVLVESLLLELLEIQVGPRGGSEAPEDDGRHGEDVEAWHRDREDRGTTDKDCEKRQEKESMKRKSTKETTVPRILRLEKCKISKRAFENIKISIPRKLNRFRKKRRDSRVEWIT